MIANSNKSGWSGHTGLGYFRHGQRADRQSGVMRKLMWIAVIWLLPIVGMGLYFLIGRSPADAHA